MADVVSEFSITIKQLKDYQFQVQFDKEQYPDLILDEPAPLGGDTAPSPSRVLAAALGNCLTASLLFCARKARVEMGNIHATVRTEMVRNEDRRLRIGRVEVVIDPQVPEADKEKAKRCLDLFEDFCIVTQSVRQGIDVSVSVKGF